jgi:hypothetical protein
MQILVQSITGKMARNRVLEELMAHSRVAVEKTDITRSVQLTGKSALLTANGNRK